MVVVRPATFRDVDLIVPRQQDIDELWSAFRSTPQDAMMVGLEKGECCVGFWKDSPLGMFGVVPYVEDVGCIWAVFTAEAEKHPKPFLRACKRQLKTMQKRYSVLMNYVDDRNTTVVNWLKWLGFSMHEPAPFGIDGKPFRLFEWRRDV